MGLIIKILEMKKIHAQSFKQESYQATEKIKSFAKRNGLRDIPIVAVTANVLQKDLDKCILSGMSDYLSKPFKKKEN